MQIQVVVIPLPAQEQERKRHDGQHEYIQNAVEDEALGDADDVASVGDGPRDGVQHPEEIEPAGEEGVVAVGRVEARGRGAAAPERLRGEEEPEGGAEGVEAPFVAGGRVGTDEIGDDPFDGQYRHPIDHV